MPREKLTFSQQVCIKTVGRAMQQAGMIQPGSRIGIAASGGVDSWIMLEVLRRRQRILPFPFEIMILHLNPGFDPDNHAPLKEYAIRHGIPAHIEVTDFGPRGHSDENRKKSACFYCAMLRRTRLFELCRLYGLTHLALGHNADDLVTTFFMNMLQNGRIDGMNPCETFFKGELQVIRPLILLEKADIRRAARQWGLSVWDNPCPSAGKTSRAAYAADIAQLIAQDKNRKKNLFNALRKWQLQIRD
ncbi:MAG: tRNA 2-thiocytidine biosynthesis TtcA family protein [Desulfovibrionaceae bacterium]|nr:tRNA 2-thiocytidine biosynthesis TtcA family protein [Desulfovibrionaceae bacterium]